MSEIFPPALLHRYANKCLLSTVSSLASIPLQDLKDFMAKAGDVAYTSVQRPKAGEGYVLFFPRLFRPVNGSELYFQLVPYPVFNVDGDTVIGIRILPFMLRS
jgi:hypothetical protein